jgi:tetratricopeptide (TPR) repeat protein
VRATTLRSQYENFQVEDAIRELLLAQELDPNAGLHQLAYMYAHVGLEDKWPPLIDRALELDPGNQLYKDTYAAYYYIAEKPDEGLAIEKRLFHRGPGLNYYRSKRMVKELRNLLEAAARKGDQGDFGIPALLLAFEGRHREAQAAIPVALKKARRDLAYHHVTYDLARTWALDGKATEAVKLLRDTAEMGFPCYPVFQRDTMLDRIRQAPEFIAFLNEQKLRWEAVNREFQ